MSVFEPELTKTENISEVDWCRVVGGKWLQRRRNKYRRTGRTGRSGKSYAT